MDIITHSFTGVLAGSLLAGRKDRLYAVILTGLIASALPDLDFILFLIDTDLYYGYHRLFTHALIAAPLIALVASLPSWLWVRSRYLFHYAVALVSIMIHLAMDLFCDWRLLLLYPFSRMDFSLGYVHYTSPTLLILVTFITAIVLLFRRGSLN